MEKEINYFQMIAAEHLRTRFLDHQPHKEKKNKNDKKANELQKLLTNSNLNNSKLEIRVWWTNHKGNKEAYEGTSYCAQNNIGRNKPPEEKDIIS